MGGSESSGHGRVLTLRVDIPGRQGLRKAADSASDILTVLERAGYEVRALEIRGHLLRQRGHRETEG
jgi:hypothetical protein